MKTVDSISEDNTEQHERFKPPLSTRSAGRVRDRLHDGARGLLAVLGTMAWLTTGGVVVAVAGTSETPCSVTEAAHAEPGVVFPTVQAAALDALAHAHHTAESRDRGRLRVGTIYRVANGFSYSEPKRSGTTLWATRSPVLRYALSPIDVASYVVHPRSGVKIVDRANESPNQSQRRIVDDLDPQNRPLFLLTPSRKVVRYANRKATVVAEYDRRVAEAIVAVR